MNRKWLNLFVLATLILCICSACGEKEGKTIVQTANSTSSVSASVSSSVSTSNQTSKETVPEIEEGDHLLIAKSEEPYNFCTKYSEDYSYAWDPDSGITIYTESEGSIPYVLVWRSFDDTTTAEELHASDNGDFYYYYGDDFISATEPQTYNLGGKKLSGVEYVYKVGEYTINMIRLVDTSPSVGYVLYTAKYMDSSKEKTLEALETAIKCYRSGKDTYETSDGREPEFEIVPSIAKTIKYETYCDGWFSMDIPEGWAVSTNSFNNSAAAFEIHIYDPKDPDKQIYTALQTLCFTSESAYKKLSSYLLAGTSFKQFPYLAGGENPLYELFQNFDVFINSGYGEYLYLSPMNNWTAIESFGETPLGGELVRASYTNDSGIEIEGVFSGKWKNGMYLNGYKYPGVFYSPMFFTAPADEFNEWAEILNHCLCSLEYTEDYIDTYYAEEKATMKAFSANTQIYNEMSDMITSSWYERQTTYDIISAKQSDATLGYDRVYNTETNEVYRVYSGFMENYSGTLYKGIDDSMYSLPISGYIY